MSPATHNLLRVHVCEVMRELGQCLDSLSLAAEGARLPGEDAAADALLIERHLSEAACAADSVCTRAAELLQAIDLERVATEAIAAPFLGERRKS